MRQKCGVFLWQERGLIDQSDNSERIGSVNNNR